MKKNNKLLIIIIIIFAIIAIIGGVFAYLYFATDTFKSEKQLFVKYLNQNSSLYKEIEENTIKDLYQKTLNNPYESSGEFKVKYKVSKDEDESFKEDIKKLDDVSISYKGKTDFLNNYVYKQMDFNYSKDIKIQTEYINSGDYFAIKINDVLNKYICVENNNLKDLFKKFGVEAENIPDKIDVEKIKSFMNTNYKLFTEEEIKQLKESYLLCIVNNLNDDNFVKNKTENGDIYSLIIDATTGKKVLIDILNNLKDDKIIFDKIKGNLEESEIISKDQVKEITEQMKKNIEESIKAVEESEITNETGDMKINLYVENKNLIKTEIEIENNQMTINKKENGFSIEINEKEMNSEEYKSVWVIEFSKVRAEDNLEYNVTISNDESEITLDIGITGIDLLNEVNTKIDFGINVKDNTSSNSIKYNIKDKKKFVDSIEDNFKKEDKVVLNQYDEENISLLMQKLVEYTTNLNEQKTKEAGFNETPFLYYSTTAISTKNMMKTIEDTDFSQQEVEAFNSKFSPYEGEKIQGSKVKALINVVKNNNLLEDEHIVDITLNGKAVDVNNEELTINTNKKYDVEMEKDTKGFINKIKIIEENTDL